MITDGYSLIDGYTLYDSEGWTFRFFGWNQMTHGYATKKDYTKGLQTYQAYLGEIKSPPKDEAAAAREDKHYFETEL